MLIKCGVEISRLKREIRRALTIADKCYGLYGEELVITSTYEGNHSAGSLHYSNDAFDVRGVESSNNRLVSELKIKLGNDYDVVLEASHIHVEYDPGKQK